MGRNVPHRCLHGWRIEILLEIKGPRSIYLQYATGTDIRNFILESEPGLSISGSDTVEQFVGWCHNYPSRHSTGKQYGCVLDIPNFSLQIHHKKLFLQMFVILPDIG